MTLMEFGVNGNPLAPHLSLAWLEAKNVDTPNWALPSDVILSSLFSKTRVIHF